jgi:hypothetical protein
MFKSLIDLGKDLTTIVAAPIEASIDVIRAATKPLAEASKEASQDIKSELHTNDP